MSAPTFGEIDISLSLRMTSRSAPETPALFIASKAMPPVIAPSPMTATDLRWLALQRARPRAMPSAALIEVLECPAPKASYSLSPRRRKPREAAALAHACGIASRRPVSTLCA